MPQVVCPILCEGDAIGSVILLNKDSHGHMGETEQILARCAQVLWDGRWSSRRVLNGGKGMVFFKGKSCGIQIDGQGFCDIPDMPWLPGISGNGFFPFWVAKNKTV